MQGPARILTYVCLFINPKVFPLPLLARKHWDSVPPSLVDLSPPSERLMLQQVQLALSCFPSLPPPTEVD